MTETKSDLKKFATGVLGFGKKASQDFAKQGKDFIPVFLVLKDEQIEAIPMPFYTNDRDLHIAMMRGVLADRDAEAFAFLMEAWFSSAVHEPGKPVNPDNYERPSLDPQRKEMLVVISGDKDGHECMLSVEIKRHGHKLVFDPAIDMTDESKGRSVLGVLSDLFGRESIN